MITEFIKNEDLTLEYLPSCPEQKATNTIYTSSERKAIKVIYKFAHTFSIKMYYDSSEIFLQDALSRKRNTLTQIRAELLLSARAARHTGDYGIVLAAYIELLPFFKEKIPKT